MHVNPGLVDDRQLRVGPAADWHHRKYIFFDQIGDGLRIVNSHRLLAGAGPILRLQIAIILRELSQLPFVGVGSCFFPPFLIQFDNRQKALNRGVTLGHLIVWEDLVDVFFQILVLLFLCLFEFTLD